jgi:hypothetical protein
MIFIVKSSALCDSAVNNCIAVFPSAEVRSYLGATSFYRIVKKGNALQRMSYLGESWVGHF